MCYEYEFKYVLYTMTIFELFSNMYVLYVMKTITVKMTSFTVISNLLVYAK